MANFKIFFGKVASAGGSGTLAVTETGSDTAALAGDVLIDGTLVVTESGSDTAAITGDVLIDGTLAATESGSDVAALAGDVYIAGTLAANESGGDTASFAGTAAAPIIGTLAATETGSDTASFSGPVAEVAESGRDRSGGGASFTGPSPDVLRFQLNMRDEQELLAILPAIVQIIEQERYAAWIAAQYQEAA